jgi:hypothetical protein
MLVDASVARSFAVVGWSHHLMAAAAESKGIVDDVCAKKAVAELARS